MQYDFETVIPRYNCGSAKWNAMQKAGLTERDDIIPFSVADMEFQTAPEIVSGLQDYIGSHVLGYANITDSFKASACAWQEKRHGWKPQPEWILTFHGVVDAFFDAVNTFTQEGDGVLLLTPVYYPMYYAVSRNNRRLVDCPLVRSGMRYDIDFDDFTRKASDPNTKLFILCSPHNPCGRVWSAEELRRLGEICLENHVFVVADEIHADLIMPGYHHTAFASLGDELARNCMLCVAPSKTFNLAGMQTAIAFLPDEARREQLYQHQLRQTANPKCSILGYQACQLAYDHCGPWLDQCIQVIDENRRIILDYFAQHFPQIQTAPLEGTYLLWMDWNGLGLDYQELERINIEEARLFFDEGYVFGEQGQGFERWNLACPTRYIRQALERMGQVYGRRLAQCRSAS